METTKTICRLRQQKNLWASRTVVYVLMVFAMLGIASGCAGLAGNVSVEPPQGIQTAPAVEPFYNPPEPSEGSLWTASASPFYTDRKATHVGDTVIVDIVENASSSLDANTEVTKSSSMGVDVTDFMGYMRALKATNPNLNATNKLMDVALSNSMTGEGTSDRKGQITASVAARIMAVLPNGNISVYGRREMKVNNETQYIIVKGLARLEDINSDNRIKSTYLADARIEYSGQGVIADKQKVGWFTRIVDNVWPF